MSEQFLFGPEHVGRRVRHEDGDKGIIKGIHPEAVRFMQMAVKWDGLELLHFYSVDGAISNFGEPVVVFLDTPTPQPDTAPDFDETPFIPNRAEAWVRFMAAMLAKGASVTDINHAANQADVALRHYEKRFLNQ